MRKLAFSSLFSLIALSGPSGCSWLEKVTEPVKFNLPSRSFTIDADQLGLPAAGIPEIKCGEGGVADCCDPGGGLSAPVDCGEVMLACENAVCTASKAMNEGQSVNLGKEVPALQQFAGQKVARIDLNSLSYDIQNGLNMELPALDIYIGPDAAKLPTDAGVTKLGTVPATAAGGTNTGAVVLDSAARNAFHDYALSFEAPFSFLVGTVVKVPGGAPAPAGQATIKIGGEAEAGFDL